MNWQLVSLERQPAQPWRNGGGLTRELLAWPQPHDWRIRLSVADVQASGPFSRFDGIERWFAVLEGDGVVLHTEDATHRLTADSAPLRFDGALAVDCSLLGGPTRDFNLMARPGASRMQRVWGASELRGEAGALLALYTHGTGAELRSGKDRLALPPFHLAWRVAEEAVQAHVAAQDALWMEAFA
ncbi:HutD family protein [Ramlibacter sp. USB13]|uniref:HutD family protein n=1 Tax=Ramlibacter cellulosilyticus TaxID=2764187 RepID=A0A923MUB9_9BURK|nr:HutD family protein [Ramlibacter cellulosilyticus]MBC5783907.1 HutD family protein [Ramlibacter cellulosilyticus]